MVFLDFLKMKKKLCIITIIFMLAVIGTANAQQYDPESDFAVEIKTFGGDKYVTIKSYIGSKNEVRIPPTIQGIRVLDIGKHAFISRIITSVIIPDGITMIRDSAFIYCTKLTSINIPNSVNGIAQSAFKGCSSLTAINVSAGSKNYMSDNGVLYNKDKTILQTYPVGKTGSSFVIPNSVTNVGDGAFSDCINLTSITIPNSVKYIGEYTFSKCTNLTSITIPNSVKYIGWSAFEGCKNLASVTMMDGVDNIEDGAFADCPKITSIIIPKSVKGIGQYAFEGCTNLVSVTFQGTIDKKYFGYEYDEFYDEYYGGDSPFDGDLREKFYATNKTMGTPGTYTRTSGGTTWTRK